MKLKKICFVLISLFILSSCLPNKNIEINSSNNQNENLTQNLNKHNALLNGKNLLGLASFKEFETTNTKESTSLTSNLRTSINVFKNSDDETKHEVEEYLKVSYAFDYVKIHSAIKFDLYVVDDILNNGLEELKLYTGLGNLEVVVAEFTTFVIDREDYDSDGNKEEILESITDTLISFKGPEGLYTILVNSYSLGNELNYEDGHRYWLFSSHKILTDTSVDKDFEPPIYCVLLEITDDNQYYLSFKKDNDITEISDLYQHRQYKIDSLKITKVARDTLYSVLELNTFTQREQIVQITSIDIEGNVIDVISDNTLTKILIDEFTELDNKLVELNELFSLLEVGSIVKVTYDEYFEGYQPTVVYANRVSIIEVRQEVTQ